MRSPGRHPRGSALVWSALGLGICISKEPPGDPDSASSPDHPSRTISLKIKVFYSHILNPGARVYA